MAVKKNNQTFLGAIILIILLGSIWILLATLRNQLTIQQNANLAHYTDIAVAGSIFLDTNRNGIKDQGEQNYTGSPQAEVELALFTSECPTLSPVPPVPPPSSGCFYQHVCPAIACRAGQVCPKCTSDVLVCPTPPSGGQVSPVSGTLGASSIADAQNNDVCKRLPVKLITCPVDANGNYACVAQHSLFTNATVRVVAPANYIVTSKNPVMINGNSAIVNFGLYPRL